MGRDGVQSASQPPSQPMHREFFCCSGEREIALNEMSEKLTERKWSNPSKSEWTSQAFVVPKALRPICQKKWRPALDYQVLNPQIKDGPFLSPLIELLRTSLPNKRITAYGQLSTWRMDSQPRVCFSR